MLYKRCSSCGKKIPYDSQCSCVSKRRREYNKQRYSKNNVKFEMFYHSNTWRKDLRTRAIKFYYHIDILEYYKFNNIVEGKIVHHIIEVKDDFNKADDISNLIYLTDTNHKRVHAIYEKSQKDKENMQKILFSLIERWKKEYKFMF